MEKNQKGHDEFKKGLNLHNLGRYEEAICCFDQALKLDPQYIVAWTMKGYSLYSLGRYKDALRCFDQALELYPRFWSAWMGKGTSLNNMSRYEEAIRCFDKVLELEPSSVGCWGAKAIAEDKIGRRQDAVQSYRRFLSMGLQDTQQIEFARQRIRELESKGDRSIENSDYLVSQDPKAGPGVIDLPVGVAYQPGDIIGLNYEVQRILGKGGFGLVYLVYDRQAGVVYALKTFRDEYLADVQTRDLFSKEASIWVDLERHPYLVRAYQVDEFLGRLYILMEYIAPNEQGINTLAGYLQRRPPDLTQSLRWAIQICHGMEYAYSKGIRAHRDIKPENIMIGQDGTAKITDFGLASVLGASLAKPGIRLSIQKDGFAVSGQAQEGGGFGTPTHMPPEQFDNAAGCDERSDIYAFGVVLFQMASGGRLPFNLPPLGDNSERAMANFWQAMRRLHREASVPQLDSPLFSVIQRCLEKEPGGRYQSFEQLRSDLEPLLKDQSGEVVRLLSLGELEAWEWTNKGNSLDCLGRHEEALRSYDQALELDPRTVFAWYGKGRSLKGLGHYAEAIHCYDQILELDPRSALAWISKGDTLDSLGRHAEALRCLDQALELDPRFAFAWITKAISLDSLGRHEEAIHCFDQALVLDPRFVTAWIGKAASLLSLGRCEEALRCCDQALKIDQRIAPTWYSKGASLLSLGRYEEAIRCFDQALELDPSDADSWYYKAKSEDQLGRRQETVRSYEQFLAVEPKDTKRINYARQRIKELEGS